MNNAPPTPEPHGILEKVHPVDLPSALLPLAAGFCALIIAMGIGRFIFNPLLPGMMTLHGLSKQVAGIMAAWNYVGYLLGALAMRRITLPARRYGFFVFWVLVSIVTTALMGCVRGETAWHATRLVSGLASGGIFVLTSAMVFDALAQAKRPGLTGFLYSGVGAGIALGGTLAPFFESHFGNNAAWVGVSLGCVPLAIFSVLYICPTSSHSQQQTRAAFPPAARPIEPFIAPGPSTGTTPAPPRNNSSVRACLNIAYFLEGLGYIISATFLVTMVKSSSGSSLLANAAWVLTGAAAACLTPLWAIAGQRMGHSRALILAFVLQSMGVLLPVLSASLPAALFSGLLFGGTFLGITLLSLQYGVSLSARPSTHTIASMTIIYGIGQIIGPMVAGRLAENGAGFTSSFALSALCLFLGAMALAAGAYCSNSLQKG